VKTRPPPRIITGMTLPPRVVRLTERVPRAVRLRRADVDFLLAHHREHVEVTPTGVRGVYRLTARGFAGVIPTPNRRLALRPKLPAANLGYLLNPLAPLPDFDDRSAPVDAATLLDALAGRLAVLMRDQAAAGLHRDYAERAAVTPFLQGRLDVAAQARAGPVRRDRLHCRYDEFTPDVACNRLAKSVADRLLARPDIDVRVKGDLRDALGGWSGVQSVPLTPELCAAEVPARRTDGYGPLLNLCRLLADGLRSGEVAGTTAGPAFLIELECVFERYVTAGIMRAVEGCLPQPLIRASPPRPGQPDFRVRPDVLLGTADRPRLVLDVKWKQLSRVALPTDDVYQVLAYAAALGASRAVLVYPGRRNRRWPYPTAGGPALDVVTLRVVGDRAACERSLRGLGRWLRRA
jgi:5-methylcytosine-specific restriction enzyme subunit McrC